MSNVSQNRTVLATERDGFINGGADHGLCVHQTRLQLWANTDRHWLVAGAAALMVYALFKI